MQFPRYMYNKIGSAILVNSEKEADGFNPLPPHKQVAEVVKPVKKAKVKEEKTK